MLKDNTEYTGINEHIHIGNTYYITDLQSEGKIQLVVDVNMLGICGNDVSNFQYSIDVEVKPETIIKDLRVEIAKKVVNELTDYVFENYNNPKINIGNLAG